MSVALSQFAKTLSVETAFTVLAVAKQLQAEVARKTAELSSQKQKVEALLVRKNDLFSNVSHEFRTPLTLILGPVDELLETSTSESDIHSLKLINRNANRLLSLVEQLLQMARVADAEKVTQSTQETAKQVAAIVSSFEHLAKKKKLM